MMRKYQTTIFIPLPPPVGGVTAVGAMLHRQFANRGDVLFFQPIPNWTKSTWQNGKGFGRIFHNSLRFLRALYQTQKGGQILMTASAYWSFWEKVVWACVADLAGRKPMIMLVSGNFPEFWLEQPKLKRTLVQKVLARLPCVLLTQSQEWEDYYRSLFPQASFQRIHSAAALEYFEAGSVRSTHKPCRNFLFVGHIFEGKGIFELLEAARLVCEQIPEASFRLVGPLFGQEAFWQEEIEKLQLQHCVKFVGAILEKENLIEEYRWADVFVFPSRAEGLPGALLEAMTMGLPCVATEVGAIPNLLDQGQAGILVPPRSPQALAQALLKLIENPQLRAEFSQKAFQHARTAYSYEDFTKSYQRILGLQEKDSG